MALSNSLIVNSSVPGHGGVVYFTQGGTLFFTGCTIAHSEAYAGGVMYVAMERSVHSNTVFSNCTIRESKAVYSNHGREVRGGAFHIDSNGCVTITGSSISGSSSAQAGGAISFYEGGGSVVVIECTIKHSYAGTIGGVIYVPSVGEPQLTFVCSIIEHSECIANVGAMYLEGGSVVLTCGSVLQHSRAGHGVQNSHAYGGALCIKGGSLKMTQNSTIVDSKGAMYGGGGVYVRRGAGGRGLQHNLKIKQHTLWWRSLH